LVKRVSGKKRNKGSPRGEGGETMARNSASSVENEMPQITLEDLERDMDLSSGTVLVIDDDLDILV